MSFLRAFVDYVMRGRRQAALAAFFSALLPGLNWLGAVVMALVTLRKGAKEGVFVALWLMLPGLAYSIAMRIWWPFLYQLLFGILLIWLLAILLRRSRSWWFLIQILAGIAMLAIIVLHRVVHDVPAFWLQIFQQNWQTLLEDFAAAKTVPTRFLPQVAVVATGLQAVGIIISSLLILAIARWLQAVRFYPGGLQKELHRLRVDRVSLLILLAIAAAAAYWRAPVLLDLLPVVCLPLVIAGFSFLHYLAARHQHGIWGLVIIYISVFVFPVVLGLIVVVALMDSLINFRRCIFKEV